MKKKQSKEKVSIHTFGPLNSNSATLNSPISSFVSPQVFLSDSTNSVNSFSQCLGVPSCSNSEIENFMTPAMVQELLEKLEDKKYMEQCEKKYGRNV